MRIIRVSQNIEWSGNWQEDVDDASYLGVTMIQVLDHYGISYDVVDINGNKMMVMHADEVYICDDYEDDVVTLKEAQDWISGMTDYELDLYVPSRDHDFWEDPAILYHGTDEDNVDSIMSAGLWMENQTRGLSNRGMGAAIFTRMEMDESGMYGGATIMIDTFKMKQDGYTPMVSGEEPLEEEAKKSELASIIGFEGYMGEEYGGEGYTDDTIAIYGNVPPKYLKEI